MHRSLRRPCHPPTHPAYLPACSQVESTLAERDWLTCGAYVAVVSVCAPLWEELIFRGFLLPSLAARLARPAALLGSSLVFALCHFRAETFAPLLLLGLVFGAAYEQCSGNLAPPMALHSLWNAYVLGSMVLQMRSGLGPVGAGLAVVGCMQGGCCWRRRWCTGPGRRGAGGSRISSSSMVMPCRLLHRTPQCRSRQ